MSIVLVMATGQHLHTIQAMVKPWNKSVSTFTRSAESQETQEIERTNLKRPPLREGPK